MPSLQVEARTVMANAFRRMEGQVEPPVQIRRAGSFVHRYADEGIRQALIQKLARNVSGLNAVPVLLASGYVQEAGVLFRTLDEIQEDVLFLATAETNGARSERHDKFLAAFYAKTVFSREDGSLDIPKPDLVPRKKVRAHILNVVGQGINTSQALKVSESLGTAYSGYVHAASENVMDMYGGNPPHFHIEGMLGTPRIESYSRDAKNYIYRGLMVTSAAAKAFGDASLVGALHEFIGKYEAANGHASQHATVVRET